MHTPEPIHPANAEGVANVAHETGAEVLRGPLRYPSETGGWALGDVDLGEHWDQYRDQELVVVVMAVGKAQEPPAVCGVCGFALGEAGECPRCKLMNAEIAEGIEARRRENEAMFGEVRRILDEEGEE